MSGMVELMKNISTLNQIEENSKDSSNYEFICKGLIELQCLYTPANCRQPEYVDRLVTALPLLRQCIESQSPSIKILAVKLIIHLMQLLGKSVRPLIEHLIPSLVRVLESPDEGVSNIGSVCLLGVIRNFALPGLITLLCPIGQFNDFRFFLSAIKLIKEALVWYPLPTIRPRGLLLESIIIKGMSLNKDIKQVAREALVLYIRKFPDRRASILSRLSLGTRGVINRKSFKALASSVQSQVDTPSELEGFAAQLSLKSPVCLKLKASSLASKECASSSLEPTKTYHSTNFVETDNISMNSVKFESGYVKRPFNTLSTVSKSPISKRHCAVPTDISILTHDIDAAYYAAFAGSDSEVDAFIEFDFDDLSSLSSLDYDTSFSN